MPRCSRRTPATSVSEAYRHRSLRSSRGLAFGDQRGVIARAPLANRIEPRYKTKQGIKVKRQLSLNRDVSGRIRLACHLLFR